MKAPFITLWYSITREQASKMSAKKKSEAGASISKLAQYVKVNLGYLAEDWSMFGDTSVSVDIVLDEAAVAHIAALAAAPGLPKISRAVLVVSEPDGQQAAAAVVAAVIAEIKRLRVSCEEW